MAAEPVPDQTFEDLAEFLDDYLGGADAVNDDLNTWLGHFKFRGFDALAILKAIKTVEPTAATQRLDMGKLCAILISRGSDISKMKLRMSPEGRAEAERLQLKYNIQRGGANLPKEVVTLSRIGATFPYICAKVSMLANYEAKIGSDYGAIPKCMGLPQLAAIFPRNDLGRQLLRVHRVFVVAFDKLINKRPDRANAISFQKVQFSSPLGTQQQRMDWCVDLHLLELVPNQAGVRRIPAGITVEAARAVIRAAGDGDGEDSDEDDEA